MEMKLFLFLFNFFVLRQLSDKNIENRLILNYLSNNIFICLIFNYFYYIIIIFIIFIIYYLIYYLKYFIFENISYLI